MPFGASDSYSLPRLTILAAIIFSLRIISMTDPNNPNIKQRPTTQWGLYQRELFWAPNEDKHPPFNTRKYNLSKASVIED